MSLPDLRFIDELPAAGGPNNWERRRENERLVASLRENVGRWAELERASANAQGRNRVYNRGSNLKRQFSGVEYTTRTFGNEIVLYVRAVSR